MKKLLIILIVLFMFNSSYSFVYAQFPPDTEIVVDNNRVAISNIDYSQYPKVTVKVSVTDYSGNPITGLSIKDFKVKENGLEQKILKVEPIFKMRQSFSILLVLDKSGSLEGSIEELKEAAKNFIDLLPDSWRVGIMTFSGSEVYYNSDFTNNKDNLKNIINEIHTGGLTPLYKAIIQAVDFINTENNKGAIIIFTDGVNEEDYPTLNEEDVYSYIKNFNAPIYTIGYIGNRPLN
ncbi:MAG: vWA domain-containing protein [Caldisericia bacterium]